MSNIPMSKKFCVIDCENQKAWDPMRFGDMFREQLENKENHDELWITCNISSGDILPENILDFQGIVISGSHFCCRDRESLPWFDTLCDLIRKVAKVGTPRLYGVCFGCQIIGYALGGEVDRNPTDRFVLKAEHVVCQNDPTTVEKIHHLTRATPIPDGWFTTGLSLIVSHGDCVRKLPPTAQLVATSVSCGAEMFLAGEHGNIYACQSHPEFDLQYAIYDRIWKGVVERNKRLNEEEIKLAQESFQNYRKSDALEFMTWMKTFLRVPRPSSEDAMLP